MTGLICAPAHLALDFTALNRLNDSTVDLDGFLSVELIFTVGVQGVTALLVSTVALLDRRSAPIDDTSTLQVTVGRLLIRAEVFDTELQPTKLDNVPPLESMVIQDGIRLLCCFVLLLGLGRLL